MTRGRGSKLAKKAKKRYVIVERPPMIFVSSGTSDQRGQSSDRGLPGEENDYNIAKVSTWRPEQFLCGGQKTNATLLLFWRIFSRVCLEFRDYDKMQ